MIVLMKDRILIGSDEVISIRKNTPPACSGDELRLFLK